MINSSGFDSGIARLPKWIAALAVVGSGIAGQLYGLPYALGFLLGAGGAFVNFRLIERFVNRLGELAMATPEKPPQSRGISLLILLAGLVTGAIVILKVSGFRPLAALCGFLVFPAAVLLEILYELVTYGHS